MIIDFHTHAFPDKLAEKAIPRLAEQGNVVPFCDGTVGGLLKKSEEDGVDICVVHSIATKKEQETNVNNFAISLLENDKIIPFGSVFPGSETALYEIERLHSAGVKGIKLHPEYQNFYIDDECVYEIYKKCASLSMVIEVHAGGDVAFAPPVHATPERIEKISSMFPDTVFVFAHMGGYDMWDKFSRCVRRHENMYIDTSMTDTVAKLEVKTALKIIDNVGVDRVLFGSDMPWARQCVSIEKVLSFGLSSQENRMIFCDNAKRLLGL